jgi:MFS family permease
MTAATPDKDEGPQRTYPSEVRAALGLLIISCGAMLGPLDSAVNIAFPAITTAFGLRVSDIQWVVICYVLAQSCFSIVFGKLGDLYGHRRVFMVGAALATIIHALAGFAPNYPALVAMRGLQGIAIGIAMSCGPALATFLYPPARKRAALSFYTMLFGVGLAIGPILGGWLIEHYGWPAVFWYRAPIALAALCFAVLLPADIPYKGAIPTFDYAGTALMVAMLGSFVAMLTSARQSSTIVWPLLMAAVWITSTWAFARVERKAKEPVVNVAFYADIRFAGIQFATLAINFFNFTIFLLAPYMMTERAGLAMAGLMLGLYPLGQIAAGIIGSRLSKGVASASLVRLGLFIAAFGVFATGIASDAPLFVIGATLFTAGFGIGIFQVGNLDMTTSILPVSARGVAGSLVNVARLIGIVIGAAVITWIYDALAQGDRMAQYRATFMLMGALQFACALALALFVFRTQGETRDA